MTKETPSPNLNQPDQNIIMEAKIPDILLSSLNTLVIYQLVARIQELNKELELSKELSKGYLDGQQHAIQTVLDLINSENFDYEQIKQILENSLTIINKLKELY